MIAPSGPAGLDKQDIRVMHALHELFTKHRDEITKHTGNAAANNLLAILDDCRTRTANVAGASRQAIIQPTASSQSLSRRDSTSSISNTDENRYQDAKKDTLDMLKRHRREDNNLFLSKEKRKMYKEIKTFIKELDNSDKEGKSDILLGYLLEKKRDNPGKFEKRIDDLVEKHAGKQDLNDFKNRCIAAYKETQSNNQVKP